MSVKGFTARFGHPLSRACLRTPVAHRPHTAGEADPLPDSNNDKAVPAEHTSPEDVSPEKPEDGNETFEHEIKRIDPGHFEPGSEPRTAALQEDLAPAPGAESIQAATPPGPGPEPMASPAVTPSPTGAPPAAPAAEGAVPGLPDGAAAPEPVPSPDPAAPAAPGAPASPATPAQPGAAPGGEPVFDFEHGLDPASQGQLVNDWQTNVDSKLFSRHTNVIKITQKGNACTFVVQAYNTDTGAKPDITTGYAADGMERGELMTHLREVFQPNGPAIGHISGTYNDFIEQQADQGLMALMRIKPSGSNFKFEPQERVIEGWSDTGLGRDPIWQGTPYSVYTVSITIQFAPIGSQGA